jgi:hypothetical protein
MTGEGALGGGGGGGGISLTPQERSWWNGSEIGSVTYGGVSYPETYGGFLFAYNDISVRLWAPSGVNGYIINVRGGWGQVNFQSETTANVNVRASLGA